MVGPEVTEFLAELGIAQRLEATWEATVYAQSDPVRGRQGSGLKGAALYV